MRQFVPPHNAIQVRSAIDIAGPPEQVAAVYRDVENWGKTFPATIEQARVIKAGDNWMEIEVFHKKEGRVPNTLIFLSDTEIGLEESKKRFNASFHNKFEPMPKGWTHYVITAYISLKGVYKLLRPFLKNYVYQQTLKQVKSYVLEPLKAAAEKERT